MVYNVTKFDGSFLVAVEEATVNNEVTDIKLIGKGATIFGVAMADNLVWMTENFASDGGNNDINAPTKPLIGQIWYNTKQTVNKLFVYKGTSQGWLPVSDTIPLIENPIPSIGDVWLDDPQLKIYVSDLHLSGDPGWDIVGPALQFNSQPDISAIPTLFPSGGSDGDLWWDIGNKQLYVYNDQQSAWNLIGPIIPGGSVSPPIEVISDTVAGIVNDGADHRILKIVVNDEIIGVWSQDIVNTGYTPSISNFVSFDRGLNLLPANPFTSMFVAKAGSTMTGSLILVSDPTVNLEAATKQYVDVGSTAKVSRTGDVMTGSLTLSGDPIANLDAATKQYVDDAISTASASASSFPIGTILPLASAIIDPGWLLCDGTTVSRTVESNLFTSIGTTWGIGDGVTTFTLPSLQGRTLIGAGPGLGLTVRTLGETGGVEDVILSNAEMPIHGHGYTHAGGGGGPGGPTGVQGGGLLPASTSANGGGQAHNNMQPYAVLNYIIKT